MKANKKGISLIVLIITIVVIIILAAAIILNLSNTNVVNNANTAASKSNLDAIQSAVTLAYGDLYASAMQDPTKSLPTAQNVVDKITADPAFASYKIVTEKSENATDEYVVDNNFVVTYYDKNGKQVK